MSLEQCGLSFQIKVIVVQGQQQPTATNSAVRRKQSRRHKTMWACCNTFLMTAGGNINLTIYEAAWLQGQSSFITQKITVMSTSQFNLKRQTLLGRIFNKIDSAIISHFIQCVCKQRHYFTHMHFSPLTHFPPSQNDERAIIWVKVKSNPERRVLFFSKSTCTGQWYPMVYVFSCGVELCFDVTVFLRMCCSPPPGSLSQLFPRQMLCASRELQLPQPDTTPLRMPNSL